MSVKTNQSIVNQLVPTLSSDSIDGSGCTLLLDLPKDVYWKIVEVSAKEQKHPDEKMLKREVGQSLPSFPSWT